MTEATGAISSVPVSVRADHHSYQPALLIGAAIVAVAAMTALVLRRRFPHHLGPVPNRVRAAV